MTYTYNATVVRVIDGDTLEVEIDLGFRLTYRTPLRVAHIDAPEHNTGAGKVAAVWVEERLGPLPAPVQVHTFKPYDKYGRYLADVYLNGEGYSLADEMLTKGYAVPYEGGKKA